MTRKQFIQIWQFVLARIAIGCFVIFVMKESFVDFLLKYWLLWLILSVSYFYYYYIEYETDKKYETIRNILIYWNIYLLAHIFFRPLLNIEHALFVLLWLILVWLWRTTKMKTKWKWILQILWWLFSFFILVSWTFYLYTDAPDTEWYIQSQKNKIFFVNVYEGIKKSDAYLQIKSSRKDESFEIVPEFSKEISQNCKISYPSLKKNRDENLIITSPGWDTILVYPQSEVEIEFLEWNKMKINKTNGKIWFLSWMFEWFVEVINAENLDFDTEILLGSIKESYNNWLIDHLHSQIASAGIMTDSTMMQSINWKLVRLLSKIFPATFSKNLRNYNEFEKYFDTDKEGNISTNKYQINQTTESTRDIWNSIKNAFKWNNGTYLF